MHTPFLTIDITTVFFPRPTYRLPTYLSIDKSCYTSDHVIVNMMIKLDSSLSTKSIDSSMFKDHKISEQPHENKVPFKICPGVKHVKIEN